jgi:proteasome alpha subunit
VAFGGQADQVSAQLKERYSDGMSLAEAFGAALSALSVPGNGDSNEVVASQLEVAILDRARDHRTFRRVRTARLDELIGESRALTTPDPKAGTESSGPSASSGASAGSNAPADSGAPTGPDPSSSDRGGGTPSNSA